MDIKFKDLTNFDTRNIISGILKALIDNGVYDQNRPRHSLLGIIELYELEVRYDGGELDEILDALTPIRNRYNDGITTIYIDERFAPCDNDSDYIRDLKAAYFNITLAHEVSHFILEHEPEYSLIDELGNINRLAHDLKKAANSRGVIGDEELAEYVAAVLLCMPIQPSEDLEIPSFDTRWADANGNLRDLANHYGVPIDCVIKLAALKIYSTYKTHYFKWNLTRNKMEDSHIPFDREYDLYPLNPYDPNFWVTGDDTAVGICIGNNDDYHHESSLLDPPYHCWAYLEKAAPELGRPTKIHVLGYPARDSLSLPGLDMHFIQHRTQ